MHPVQKQLEPFNLYILVEPNSRDGEQWFIYSKKTGREVATYRPRSRRLRVGFGVPNYIRRGHEHVTCKDWHQALRKILKYLKDYSRRNAAPEGGHSPSVSSREPHKGVEELAGSSVPSMALSER